MTELTNKRRWFIVPCPDYDVPAMESWLEEQALHGWYLTKDDGFFLGLACFVQGIPKRVRYRLDAIPKEKAFAEFPENKAAAIELAQELGWEYVTERKEFLFYRCMDDTLPELNTDSAVQALSLKRVQSALAGRIFNVCYFLFLYPFLNLSLRFPAFLLSVLTLGTLRFLGMVAVTAVLLVGAVRDWRRLKKLRAHLRSGGRIEHTNGWHDEKTRCIAEKILHPILTAVWFALLLSFIVGRTDASVRVTDASTLPVPTLSAIAELRETSPDDHTSLHLRENSDLLAPVIDEIEEGYGSYICDTTYYELRTPWLAKWLASDLRRYDNRHLFGKHAYEITEFPLPDLGMDTAYCYYGRYYGNRVIVQKGCKVVSAYIWWPSDDAFPAETIARALAAAIE